MAGDSILYRTEFWDQIRFVSGGDLTFSSSGGGGIVENNVYYVAQYRPGQELVIGYDSIPNSIQFDYDFNAPIIVDCLALIGANFTGNVSIQYSQDGGGSFQSVSLDDGFSTRLPDTSYGPNWLNNKWLRFSPIIAERWRVSISGIQLLADVPVSGQGHNLIGQVIEITPTIRISRIVGGLAYDPPRSHRKNPQQEFRRAGEESNKGSFIDPAAYPGFIYEKVSYQKVNNDQYRRFREISERRAVREPIVFCFDSEPEFADEQTFYVQWSNRVQARSDLRQWDVTLNLTEVKN